MNRTSNFTIAFLALAGAAFAQKHDGQYLPKGYLIGQNDSINRPIIRPNPNQLSVENQVAWYKRCELDQRRAHQTCMDAESKKRDGNPYNCQFRINAANDYARKAAELQQSQRQFGTTHASQALRFPVPLPPPSQVSQHLPQMRSYINNGNSRR